MSRTVYVYRGKVKHCCKYCGLRYADRSMKS